MPAVNLDKEWSFVVKETHSEKAGLKNLVKREILFALQVLLCKIATGKARQQLALKRDYSLLKEWYCLMGQRKNKI